MLGVSNHNCGLVRKPEASVSATENAVELIYKGRGLTMKGYWVNDVIEIKDCEKFFRVCVS